MIDLLDLTEWVDTLKAQCPEFQNRIYASLPDDELFVQLQKSPALFVYQSDDQSEPNQMGKGPDCLQRMTVTVTTEIFIRRQRKRSDPYDADLMQSLRQLRESVLNALIAFRPAHSIQVVAHSNGQIATPNFSRVSYRDTFLTRIMIKGEK